MFGRSTQEDCRYCNSALFVLFSYFGSKFNRSPSIVLEENRGVLEREIHHLRTLVKDADQQVARLTEDLNVNQQKLERSQDAQNRWKERSEALVEQLQAEQNRTILAEQAVTKYMNKAQAIKMHFQQVSETFSVEMIFDKYVIANFLFLIMD